MKTPYERADGVCFVLGQWLRLPPVAERDKAGTGKFAGCYLHRKWGRMAKIHYFKDDGAPGHGHWMLVFLDRRPNALDSAWVIPPRNQKRSRKANGSVINFNTRKEITSAPELPLPAPVH